MKLIELLRTLDNHTYVRINALETNIKGWVSLMEEIFNADCADYRVTYIHCLWHAQELYIGCMNL